MSRGGFLTTGLITLILSFPAASEEMTVQARDIACRDPSILDRAAEAQRNNDPDGLAALVLPKLTTGDCIEVLSGDTVIVLKRGPLKTKISSSGRKGEYWIVNRALQ